LLKISQNIEENFEAEMGREDFRISEGKMITKGLRISAIYISLNCSKLLGFLLYFTCFTVSPSSPSHFSILCDKEQKISSAWRKKSPPRISVQI
jgi:hypothetical protein